MSYFDYYAVSIRLTNPMNATNPSSADILKEHLIAKSQRLNAEATKNTGKLVKTLKKYVGESISPTKERDEIISVIRSQLEQLGQLEEDLPLELSALVEYSLNLQEQLKEKLSDINYKSTVFFRGKSGEILVSSHMLIGFFKGVLENITGSLTKEEKATAIFKYKVTQTLALTMDAKFVDTFMVASEDIDRDPVTKERILNIRPLRFSKLGVQTTCLTASETLPAKSVFNNVLRVRKGSALTEEALHSLFIMGRSIGLGGHRGASNAGQFNYKLELLKDFEEKIEGADEGWR